MQIRDIARIGIFTALMAALAQISIPLPFTPVPITFGLVGVFMTGILLPPKNAFFAQLAYVLLGAAGMPVFHNFTGGLGILVSATGGYLVAYPFMAPIIAAALEAYGRLSRRKNSYSGKWMAVTALCASLVALALCYASATIWISILHRVSIPEAMVMGVYPFALLDAGKAVFCVVCVLPLKSRLNRVLAS